jgi:hypothetical protein
MEKKAQAPRTLMEIREIPKDSLCPEDLKGAVSVYGYCEDFLDDIYPQQVIKVVLEDE